MSLTVEQAYAQIKQLENSGQLPLPEPKETIEVGSIDVSTGTFTWTVPTITQTIVIPPNPPITKTNTIINTPVGVVATKAVDLILKFDVTGARSRGTLSTARVALAAPARHDALGTVLGSGSVVAVPLGPSGLTIVGFPTISNTAGAVVVDAGLACSAVMPNAPNVTPPVTTFMLTLKISGHADVFVHIMILRPPVLGMGAFTLPAVPITIVYAPPQGKQNKNSASYTDMTSFTRTMTTSVNSSKTVKSAQAYTAADLISKVASAISAIVSVASVGGAGGGGSASGGLLGALATALVGNPKAEDASLSVSDSAKLLSSELSLVSNVLTAVATSTQSTSATLTTQDDHSVKVAITDMSMFSSAAGLGPGAGDRVVYMKNVKVVWMAVNGEVDIHVLGFESVRADSVQSLLADEQAAKNGGQNNSGLDAATLRTLLNMDPFTAHRSALDMLVGRTLVAPPRFTHASPFERAGVGTGGSGDVFTVSVDVTTEDKHTETSVHTTVTDDKPGWVSVLFGGSNVETTTTMTFTNTESSDEQNEEKVTNTVALFSQDATDPYDVVIFYDKTFGTFLYASKDSPVLKSDGVVVSTTTLTTA